MKKLILSVIVVAFTVAAQAGDAKKEGGSCCSKAAGAQTKASCPASSKTACAGEACKGAPVKQALLSPKAAAEVTKKL